MPKFSANLTMLFKEVEFLDRFELAAKAGFKGVEFLFPYDWDKEELQERLMSHNLELVLHNLPAGHWGAGERGLACLPNRVGEFRDGLGLALEYAQALKCPRLNCLAGIPTVDVAQEDKFATLVSNVRFAAEEAGKAGIQLLLEALNSQDMPGFCLSTTRQVLEVMKAVDHPNVYIQYDVYHMQIAEGNLIGNLTANVNLLGHLHIADVPGRHEPGTGEINFPNVLAAVSRAGYEGCVGMEMAPTGDPVAAIKAAARMISLANGAAS